MSKGHTISFISENLSPIYWVVSEKLSLKTLKVYKECVGSHSHDHEGRQTCDSELASYWTCTYFVSCSYLEER